MKLQSMTDYVLELNNNLEPNTFKGKLIKIVKYASFLKQPLTLGMFIPTDENGNILEQPLAGMSGYDHIYKRYSEAKDRIIFEGFEILYQDSEDDCVQDKSKQAFIFDRKTKLFQSDDGEDLKTIEDLVKYNLTITETAVKKYVL